MKCLDDARIIELFLAGDESALRETELKYGGELKSLSYRITGSKEDAAECFNDTLLKAWESIPDEKAYAKIIDDDSLANEIESWLLSVSEDKRAIFIRRYFRFETSRSIAKSLGIREGAVAATLLRLRTSLKEYLAAKDYIV